MKKLLLEDFSTNKFFENVNQEVLNIIEKKYLEFLEEADEWISVDEHLPEIKQTIIAIRYSDNHYWLPFMTCYSMELGFYPDPDENCDSCRESHTITHDQDITHWKYLPKPPKEKPVEKVL